MNYLAIGLAGLAFWLLGALWYSPILFGKAWQKESGLSDDDIKGGNMAIIFGTSFLLMCLMSIGVSFIVGAHAEVERTFSHGAVHGVMAGVMFAATSIGINSLYQRKSMKLYLIDALYQVLGLGLAGGVLGYMM